MSKNEGVMKNTELPKIRATPQQLAEVRASFNRSIDRLEDAGELHSRKTKKAALDILHTFFEIAHTQDVTMIGEPGKLMRVEAHGEQGCGKTLLVNLLDSIDRSVRSENGSFYEALITLNAIIQDYGIFSLAQAIPQENNRVIQIKPGYDGLASILVEALEQAQQGKGDERHNPTGAVPFEDQRMQTISRMIGSVKGMEYQAVKKLTEGLDMPELDRQVKELLGVINYVAGIITFLRAKNLAERADDPDAF